MADLEEAIQISRQAVDVTPEDHPNRARRLNSLGVSLRKRYSRTGAMADLEEAIQIGRQAVNVTPEDHPDYARRLNSLGVSLRKRYSKTGAIADLEEAIQVGRQAVDVIPEDHPDRAEWLSDLGIGLGDRYSRTGAIADLEEGIQSHLYALTSDEAPIDKRIDAGMQLLRLYALGSDWERGSTYSTMAVKLVPRLNARSLENSDKQHRLSQIVGLACDASAAALNAGKLPLVALDLLEQGRGLLATSLDEMRTDILDLRVKHPELADQLTGLRNELQSPIMSNTSSPDEIRTPFLKSQTDRRHSAGSRLDRLIAAIQQQSGFENFLRPPSEGEILDAAKYGPIVVINVSEYRCDAILVDQHRIRSVPLPGLTYKGVEEKVKLGNLGSSRVLKWLWDAVALPVVDALGFTEPPSDDNRPHVWWIPTGPLSKFPLHAAGYHGGRSKCTVLDRVMSSYSSSIKVLIQGRQRRKLQNAQKTANQALLVALQNTPNQSRLNFAADEVNMLHDLCGSLALHPVQPKKRKEEIMSLLPTCRIFHFAGHGQTDNEDPSKSCLLLEDWEDNPLTVGNLMEMNLREHAPFLAYLSACGTGEIRNERFFDENIHLISACQLAGFRHVIGTLWEVNDESCVDMAKTTYDEILHGGMTDESVCLGLHKATRELRDRWLRDSKEVRYRKKLARNSELGIVEEMTGMGDERNSRLPRKVNLCDSDEEEDGSLHWVPYVHFGV
jgi:hypothetical protein